MKKLSLLLIFGLAGLAMNIRLVSQAPQTANKLGDGPWTYTTSERNTRIRVSVVTKGLSHPWSIVWLPDGDMLVTERQGGLGVVRHGGAAPTTSAGGPH